MLQFLKMFFLRRKAKSLLHNMALISQRKSRIFTDVQNKRLSLLAKQLHYSLQQDDFHSIQTACEKVKTFLAQSTVKTSIEHTKEFATAILVAGVLAVIIRSMWFEIYQIPSGSMRPTFRELDDLTVSKTQFGLNIPLMTDHFLFNPNEVERGKVVIFSGDRLDMPNTDTTYFWLFPGKKRYIKRLIGKPGDTLYFYGGKIYGLDEQGNPINELLEDPYMQKLHHVPFLHFEGRISQSAGGIVFKHFNTPVGKLLLNRFTPAGEILVNGKWESESAVSFSDFFGIRNFGMTRLLSPDEAKKHYTNVYQENNKAKLFLEIAHSPTLSAVSQDFYSEEAKRGILLSPNFTVIPLGDKQIEKLKSALFTARFDVTNGIAKRYSDDTSSFSNDNPQFQEIPDGRYEFYYGKAYKVHFAGILQELPNTSPVYPHSNDQLQKLFNMGIDFSTVYAQNSALRKLFPHRYTFFRDGDLYVMGEKIFDKEDPELRSFVENEKTKEKNSTLFAPYKPFIDHGNPIQNGIWNTKLIQSYGIKVPDKQYLVLGDNHPMSADSRYFGFVPEENLQGVPSFLFWPPGDRFASSSQTPYATFTPYRVVVWVIAFLGFFLFLIVQKKIRHKRVQCLLDS